MTASLRGARQAQAVVVFVDYTPAPEAHYPVQNEQARVSTADKIEFVNRLTAAHLPVIEVSAFVSPKWVPQMADAAEVFAGITRAPGTRYTALVPNLSGLDRAVAAGVSEIATDKFKRRRLQSARDHGRILTAESEE